MESELFQAARFGDFGQIRDLLSSNPGLDVNKKIAGWAALHIASFTGVPEPLELLLSHPSINVNIKSDSQRTPFYLACYWGKLEVVRMLAGNKDVDVSLTDDEDCSPLWWAARKGHDEVILWLIASGRSELCSQLGKESMHTGDSKPTTPREIAAQKGFVGLAQLLKEFQTDEVKTRHRVRLALGDPNATAAECFSLGVLLSDGFLALKADGRWGEREINGKRFFRILERLPMELQMVLCHRANQRMRNRIRVAEVRVAVEVIREAFSPNTTTSTSTSTKSFWKDPEEYREDLRLKREACFKPLSASSASASSVESPASSWVFEKIGRSLLEFLREILVRRRRPG